MRPIRARRTAIMAMAVAGALAAGPIAAQPANAATPRPAERTMKRLINETRAAHGLKALKLSLKSLKPCRKHSGKMASQQQLWHSNLNVTLKNVSWKSAGENVGVASTVASLHLAFLDSSAHRANILGKSWDRVAIGFRTDSIGMRWATVVFYSN